MLDVFASKRSGTVYWQNRIVPVSVASSGIWIYGIAGSLIAGLGAIWSFMVYVPFRGKQKWSWVCLSLGSGIWFVIGASLSVVHYEWAGLLIHVLLMALIGFPLMKTKKDFS
jgi:hypothetical protein